MLGLVKDLSLEQLNKVPAGFNNNIIWNIAHLVASQQGLCYMRAGLPVVLDEKFVGAYKSGTKPEQEVSSEQVEEIKKMLFSTLDRLETDYKNGVFTQYTAFQTRYDIEIASVDGAIDFLIFHEGLHMGYIMALKRALMN